jgi:hypothetical protein
LSPEVRRIVHSEFLQSVERDSPVFNDYELDDLTPPVEIEAFEEVIASLPAGTLKPAGDAAAAQAIRSTLSLTPRQASDPSVWWWLTLRRYPDVVRRRWADRSGSVSVERMLGSIARNAFGRLWWAAEMVEGDGERLARMFGNQDLFEAVIGRKLGRNPAALKVILDRLAERPGVVARETVRDLHQVLSTIVLEALTPDDLAAELDRLYERRVAAERSRPV